MISSTSTSGAEAPAVMPIVRMSPSGAQSMSAARSTSWLFLQPARSRHFLEALRVRRIGRAHHQQRIHLVGDLLHGFLPVGGGVADVLLVGADDVGEAQLQRLDDALRVVDRQRGLGHEGERLAPAAPGRARRPGDARRRCSRPGSRRPAAAGPSVPTTSGWPAWPTRMMRVAAAVVQLRLAVHLGDQRAGRVDGEELARSRPRAARPSARHGPRRSPARRCRGISSSSSTKMAPFFFRLSTTYLLCTISCRT